MEKYKSQREILDTSEALLQSLAHEYAASGVHQDDLYQEGALALLLASDYQGQQSTEEQVRKGMQKYIGQEKKQSKPCQHYKLCRSGRPIREEATS